MKKTLEKQLVRLAGEDYVAYNKCGRNSKRRIALSGLVVLLIFITSLLSITEALSQLFHSFYVGIAIGIFFAWLVANMYLLLLYTLTKNILVPDNVKAHSRLSFAIRLCTVLFFAVVVSKPIEHFIFEKHIQTELIIKKSQAKEEITKLMNVNYSTMFNLLSKDVKRIKELKYKKAADIATFHQVIDESNYYFYSVNLISNNPFSWLFTSIIGLLFCIPLWLKRGIDKNSIYYKEKKKYARSVVINGYDQFKKDYYHHLKKYTDEDIEINEIYHDPPFNFIKISNTIKHEDESDFIVKVYE